MSEAAPGVIERLSAALTGSTAKSEPETQASLPAGFEQIEGLNGRDHFDRALRAASRAFRESMIAGMGSDERGHDEFFKPGSSTKLTFYSLFAEYGVFEMMRLAERFKGKA